MATKTVTTNKDVKLSERASKYFRGVLAELKKVHWPNRNEIITYTGVVLASVFIVAALLWIVDSVFSFILSKII